MSKLQKLISVIVLCIVFVAGYYVVSSKAKSFKNVVAAEKKNLNNVDLLYEKYEMEKRAEDSFKESINYYNSIPMIVDETYKLKRNAAQLAVDNVTSRKDEILLKSKREVITAIHESLNKKEIESVLAKLEKTPYYDLESEEMEKLFASNRYRKNFKLPREELSRVYQHYLDELRKRYGILPGKFAPEQSTDETKSEK